MDKNQDIDKSQYQTPQTLYNSELLKEIEKSSIESSPERYKSPFQMFSDLGQLLVSSRDSAVAIEQLKGRPFRVPLTNATFILPARPEKVIRKDNGEKERSSVGRKIFDGNYVFWMGEKGESIYATDDVYDWYLAPITEYGFDEKHLLHIETMPNQIVKFGSDGKPMPLSIQDFERFVPAAVHYVSEVIEEVYPFDASRAEVILDGMEMSVPENIAHLVPPRRVSGTKDDFGLAA